MFWKLLQNYSCLYCFYTILERVQLYRETLSGKSIINKDCRHIINRFTVNHKIKSN
jgi:hypothetical protein